MIAWVEFAQTATPDGWGEIVSTYGPFAPFAALLLWLLQLLWKDNKEKEAEIRRLTETAMEKVIPTVLDATKVLSESVEVLKGTREQQLAARQLVNEIEALSVKIDAYNRKMHGDA